MKKFFKLSLIFTVNLLLIYLIILLLNNITYYINLNESQKQNHSNINFHFKQFYEPVQTFNTFYQDMLKNYPSVFIREDSGEIYKNNKRPILILGCSFAYGDGLQQEQTFGAKLSKYSQRHIINKAICGYGPNHTLYQLRNDESFKNIINPEYVIFVFIDNHINRVDNPCFNCLYNSIIEPTYKITYKNNQKILTESYTLAKWLYGFYFVRYLTRNIKCYIYESRKETTRNKHFDLLKTYFEEIYKEIKNLYPNTKFVILLYPDWKGSWYINTPRWKELENIGNGEHINIINLNDLTGVELYDQKYKLLNNHPNEDAWNIIVPQIAKELNL